MTGFTFFTGLIAGLNLVNAQSTVPSSSLCPTANGRTIYDDDGAGYLVTCSADNDRGSYTNTQAINSYIDCMNACDADAPCVGFTYVGGNQGACSGNLIPLPPESSILTSAVKERVG